MTIHIENVSPAVQDILTSLQSLEDIEVSEPWLRRWSDAINRFSDLYMAAYVNYYANTKDQTAKERFQSLQQESKPEVERLEQRLTAKAAAYKTDDERFVYLLERIRASARIQVPENVALEAEAEALATEYNRLISQQLVALEEPTTMATARARLRNEPDCAKREWVWRQREARKAEDVEMIDDLFLRLVRLRTQMAQNAGVESYLEYAWTAKHRFDYAPEDVVRWLDDITEVFADTQRQYAEHLANQLGVDHLRPWDAEFTQANSPVGRSFSEADYHAALVTAFGDLKPAFGEIIEGMAARGHLDLMSRANKVPTNFATMLTTHNEPIVFCNGTGDANDLRVMLHECGHAVHNATNGPGRLFFDKGAPKEFSEFAAYTFQTLGSEALAQRGVLSADEMTYFRRYVLNFVLDVMSTDKRVEHFQYGVYQSVSDFSIDEFDERWLDLQGDVPIDWSGLEAYQKKGWQRTHIIVYPLYNIEYVISWVGTLLFLNRYRQDPQRALSQFETALRFGKTEGIKAHFTALDIPFPFRRQEIEQAHDALEREFLKPLAILGFSD